MKAYVEHDGQGSIVSVAVLNEDSLKELGFMPGAQAQVTEVSDDALRHLVPDLFEGSRVEEFGTRVANVLGRDCHVDVASGRLRRRV